MVVVGVMVMVTVMVVVVVVAIAIVPYSELPLDQPLKKKNSLSLNIPDTA